MTYVLEVKELPGQAPTAPPAAAPAPPPIRSDDTPRWSGDLYQEGDETSPEESQWSFTGANGEEAWLDRSSDGTITGWVRDPDGTVYRYTDPDAWAVDVDDAGMTRSAGAEGEGEGEMPDGAGEDPNAVEDPTAGDDYADPNAEPEVDEDAAYDDYVNGGDEQEDDPADEEDDPNEAEPDGDVDDAEESDPSESEPDDDEDDENEDVPFAKKKKGREAKVYHLPYR